MAWIASLAKRPEGELDRLIKRIGAILLVGAVIFTAFYLFDRWRPAAPAIVDQELVALEAAVREDPADVAARGRLADVYVAKGRYDEAITQYNAVLETGKAEELAKFGRAGAYMGLEQYDLAAADYQAVVEIAKGGEMANVDPMLEAAYYGLGSIAMKQARPADAIPFLENALRIKRSDADALYLIGQAYAQTGATDKAEIALRRAVAFVPIGWSEPYAALAEAFTNAGRTAMAEWASVMADVAVGKVDTAESRLKAIVDTEAGLDAAIGLGLLYESRGELVAAAEWYEAALARDATNDAALLGLGRVGPVPVADPAQPAPSAGEVTQP
ncbi:MAG TPA: tetratricopeptide repeat protein [Candidatus Sulfomarinibacteraceae bacterium]|nr:tetratricopeptide repeat protein [Candidatus Sulfomarinibacteraceae bacterium]